MPRRPAARTNTEGSCGGVCRRAGLAAAVRRAFDRHGVGGSARAHGYAGAEGGGRLPDGLTAEGVPVVQATETEPPADVGASVRAQPCANSTTWTGSASSGELALTANSSLCFGFRNNHGFRPGTTATLEPCAADTKAPGEIGVRCPYTLQPMPRILADAELDWLVRCE